MFKMTAASRKRGHIDLFAVGPDRLLYVNSSDDEGTTWSLWTLVPNSITMPEGSRPVALSESPGTLLLAVVDDSGLCQSIAYDSGRTENGGWGNWTQIGGSGVRLEAGPALCAFVVAEQHILLIALGQDRRVYTTWRSAADNNGDWHHWTPVGWDASTAASLAAVARRDPSQRALQVLLFVLTDTGDVAWTISHENLSAPPQLIDPGALVPSVPDLDKIRTGELLSDAERQQRQSIVKSAYTASGFVPQSVRALVEEAFYFVPVHAALQLQKSGAFEASLDWFRLTYDYTAPALARKIVGLPNETGSTGYRLRRAMT